MASTITADFFENGTNRQFEWVLGKYQETLQAKADGKPGKAETLLKLDKWYQNDLPKKIKSRGKEAHLTHDEIVQTIKWKLARGQFRPRLKDLIQMNTPRVVMQETKKAFRAIFKRNDLEAAAGALCNLKGVGPAMASAVLAAGCPEIAPFMADECLLSMPEVEGIDYTMKEYMKLVQKTQQCVDRLNAEGGTWTPHTVELAVWTHYVARDLKPEILEELPSKHEEKKNRFSGALLDLPEANGEVSEVAEVAEEAVESGESTPEEVTEFVKEVAEDVTNGVTINGESSEVLTEASVADYGRTEVPVEAANEDTYDTTNGTYGTYGDPTEVSQNYNNYEVEAPVDVYAEVVHAAEPTKRPLEDPEEVSENKRVREEVAEIPDIPCELPNSETSNGAAVVTPHPILTGCD